MSRRDPVVQLNAPAHPRWRLLAFPPAGAGAAFYRPWTQLESGPHQDGLDLRAVRYPGRESRLAEPLATSIGALADEAAQALEPLLASDTLPTAIVGHSMGAAVAAETAARLHARLPGRVDLLVLSARAAPGSTSPTSQAGPAAPGGLPAPRPLLARLFGRRAATATGSPAGAHPDDNDTAAVVATDESLTAWMRRIGGTPAELLDDEAFMAMQLPILRADLLVSARYETLPDPIPVRIMLLRAQEDTLATAGAMARWSAMTSASTYELTIDGGHHAILDQANDIPAQIYAQITNPSLPAVSPE